VLSLPAEAFLCRKKTGEKAKKARRARWQGDREEERRGSRLPFFSSHPTPRANYAIFIGMPSGSLGRGETGALVGLSSSQKPVQPLQSYPGDCCWWWWCFAVSNESLS